MVVAQTGFRDEEYFIPKEILAQAGFSVATASFKKGPCQSKFGKNILADLSIVDLDIKNFTAVVFVGGSGLIEHTQDKNLIALARQFFQAGKLTSAICIAPEVLAYAGLLKGKQATCTPCARDTLEKYGAILSNTAVAIDGKIITANGPLSAAEFGQELVRALHNEN